MADSWILVVEFIVGWLFVLLDDVLARQRYPIECMDTGRKERKKFQTAYVLCDKVLYCDHNLKRIHYATISYPPPLKNHS